MGRSDDVGLRPSPEARPEGELSTEEGERRKARIERDALATIGERKVERLGCAHCGADDIVGWGRSHGLPRYRCKACGRTFNAATRTGMARLRKKDRWLDQAQAMIDALSLAKGAERRGVHPTTAYRWRHRFLSAPAIDKPQTLQGIVEADETFILELFKGRRSGLARKARKRGGKARHPAAFPTTSPFWRPATVPRHDRRRPARGHGRMHHPGAGERHVAGKRAGLRRRPASARFRPTRQNSCPRGSRPGKAAARRARHPHQQRQCLPFASQVVDAPLPRRRDPQPAQLSGLRRALEASAEPIDPQGWMFAALGQGANQQLMR